MTTDSGSDGAGTKSGPMKRMELDRSIPVKYASKSQRLELSGIAALYERNYPRAVDLFSEQYELLLQAQRDVHR